jgi:hypothetical protein
VNPILKDALDLLKVTLRNKLFIKKSSFSSRRVTLNVSVLVVYHIWAGLALTTHLLTHPLGFLGGWAAEKTQKNPLLCKKSLIYFGKNFKLF